MDLDGVVIYFYFSSKAMFPLQFLQLSEKNPNTQKGQYINDVTFLGGGVWVFFWEFQHIIDDFSWNKIIMGCP